MICGNTGAAVIPLGLGVPKQLTDFAHTEQAVAFGCSSHRLLACVWETREARESALLQKSFQKRAIDVWSTNRKTTTLIQTNE
eukprot:scaffold314_cov562-Prasinococcus_capsulatus_cf.AAC.6